MRDSIDEEIDRLGGNDELKGIIGALCTILEKCVVCDSKSCSSTSDRNTPYSAFLVFLAHYRPNGSGDISKRNEEAGRRDGRCKSRGYPSYNHSADVAALRFVHHE